MGKSRKQNEIYWNVNYVSPMDKTTQMKIKCSHIGHEKEANQPHLSLPFLSLSKLPLSHKKLQLQHYISVLPPNLPSAINTTTEITFTANFDAPSKQIIDSLCSFGLSEQVNFI